jgi:predicted XRE-type DNA-binding protein
MDKTKRAKLEKAGMIVTDAAGWLGLDPEEAALVEMRANLAREVERLRRENGVTQVELAEKMGTKQPGVARMERNPSSTTLDALFRALLKLGASPRKIAALL